VILLLFVVVAPGGNRFAQEVEKDNDQAHVHRELALAGGVGAVEKNGQGKEKQKLSHHCRQRR
jgi:hypothetical protein